jgi:hypothetical protein
MKASFIFSTIVSLAILAAACGGPEVFRDPDASVEQKTGELLPLCTVSQFSQVYACPKAGGGWDYTRAICYGKNPPNVSGAGPQIYGCRYATGVKPGTTIFTWAECVFSCY